MRKNWTISRFSVKKALVDIVYDPIHSGQLKHSNIYIDVHIQINKYIHINIYTSAIYRYNWRQIDERTTVALRVYLASAAFAWFVSQKLARIDRVHAHPLPFYRRTTVADGRRTGVGTQPESFRVVVLALFIVYAETTTRTIYYIYCSQSIKRL